MNGINNESDSLPSLDQSAHSSTPSDIKNNNSNINNNHNNNNHNNNINNNNNNNSNNNSSSLSTPPPPPAAPQQSPTISTTNDNTPSTTPTPASASASDYQSLLKWIPSYGEPLPEQENHGFSCTNCQATKSPAWHGLSKSEPTCSACYVYFRRNGRARDVGNLRRGPSLKYPPASSDTTATTTATTTTVISTTTTTTTTTNMEPYGDNDTISTASSVSSGSENSSAFSGLEDLNSQEEAKEDFENSDKDHFNQEINNTFPLSSTTSSTTTPQPLPQHAAQPSYTKPTSQLLRICNNCQVTHSAIWYNHPIHLSSGLKLCNACWQYHRKHPGQMRDINNVRRGRPRLSNNIETLPGNHKTNANGSVTDNGGMKRKRGRPPKKSNGGGVVVNGTSSWSSSSSYPVKTPGVVDENGVFKVNKSVILNMMLDSNGDFKVRKKPGRPRKTYELLPHSSSLSTGGDNNDDEPLPKKRKSRNVRNLNEDSLGKMITMPASEVGKRKSKIPGRYRYGDSQLEGEAMVLSSKIATPNATAKSKVRAQETPQITYVNGVPVIKRKRGRPPKNPRPEDYPVFPQPQTAATDSSKLTASSSEKKKKKKKTYSTSLRHVQRDSIIRILKDHHEELMRGVEGVVDKVWLQYSKTGSNSSPNISCMDLKPVLKSVKVVDSMNEDGEAEDDDNEGEEGKQQEKQHEERDKEEMKKDDEEKITDSTTEMKKTDRKISKDVFIDIVL